MANISMRVTVRGIPSRSDINVRSGPGTGYEILFRLPIGTTADVLEAAVDVAENHFQGKVYQWLRLRLADGREGWARDDLLTLQPGDYRAIGYGIVTAEPLAFDLIRDTKARPAAGPAEAPAAGKTTAPEAPANTPPVWIPAAPAGTPADKASAETVTTGDPAVGDFAVGDFAVVIGGMFTVNVRSGPGTTFAIVTRAERGARLPIFDVQQEAGGPFRWVKVKISGQEGWIREDLLSFVGPLALNRGLIRGADMYPAPMQRPNYWWVRGFEGPQPAHSGWDLGAAQGEPVLAGPRGGVVITVFRATRPTPDRPRALDWGYAVGDIRLFSDPGWGFGYGHYVVVRYTQDVLPAYTQRLLAEKGMAGGAACVMVAHLSTIAVQVGQQVGPGQVLGACGTTGNSERPHVHLEVRLTGSPVQTVWSAMLSGLVDPGVLYNR